MLTFLCLTATSGWKRVRRKHDHAYRCLVSNVWLLIAMIYLKEDLTPWKFFPTLVAHSVESLQTLLAYSGLTLCPSYQQPALLIQKSKKLTEKVWDNSLTMPISAALALSCLLLVLFTVANLQIPYAVAVFCAEKISSSPNVILWTVNSLPHAPHSKHDQTNGHAIHGGKVGTWVT